MEFDLQPQLVSETDCRPKRQGLGVSTMAATDYAFAALLTTGVLTASMWVRRKIVI